MRPDNETIGVFFSHEDIGNASLAQEIAHNSLRRDTLPPALAGSEIVFPAVHDGEEVLLDTATTQKIITLAKLACSASDQRQYIARNRYVDLRYNHAEVDILEAAAIEEQIESENTELFRQLSELAEQCIIETADFAIERGLSNQTQTSI